jgi:hypothetical protein
MKMFDEISSGWKFMRRNLCVRRDWYFLNCFLKVPIPSDAQIRLTHKLRECSPFICCNRYAGAALQSPHYSVFKHYAGRFFLAEADGLSMN